MRHHEFVVGQVFYTGTGAWQCTDKGMRVIVAIQLDPDQDPSWRNGPPYAIVESVFDEHDMQGCWIEGQHAGA